MHEQAHRDDVDVYFFNLARFFLLCYCCSCISVLVTFCLEINMRSTKNGHLRRFGDFCYLGLKLFVSCFLDFYFLSVCFFIVWF